MCINNIFKWQISQADVQIKSIFGRTGEAILPPLVSTDMALVRMSSFGHHISRKIWSNWRESREGKEEKKKEKKTGGLENMTYEKRLKELGLFFWRRRRLKRDMITVFKYVKDCYKKEKLLSTYTLDRTRNNKLR